MRRKCILKFVALAAKWCRRLITKSLRSKETYSKEIQSPSLVISRREAVARLLEGYLALMSKQGRKPFQRLARPAIQNVILGTSLKSANYPVFCYFVLARAVIPNYVPNGYKQVAIFKSWASGYSSHGFRVQNTLCVGRTKAAPIIVMMKHSMN